MRKLFMALAAVAALGLTIPLSTPADAQSATVVVKKRYGDRHVHPRKKVVIIKRDRHRHHHVRAHARPNTVVIVKKKRTPRATVTNRRD